jgi:hypothetical protein
MSKKADSGFSEEPIFQYRGLAYAPSWLCDSLCKHCFIPPRLRKRDGFDEKVALRVIQGAPKSVRVIAFTGGEMFVNPQRLLELLRLTRKSGRVATVVTNGLWMSDFLSAKRLLRKAYEAGLRALSLSIDRYHFPVPDVASVVRSLAYARSLGIALNVRSAGKPRSDIYRAILASRVLKDQGNPRNIFDLENVGLASRLPVDRIGRPVFTECLSALQPIITPDGRFVACCQAHAFEISNSLLDRGNVLRESVSSIVARAERDYLLAAIVVRGPAGLLRFLQGIARKTGDSRCDLCLRITNDKNALARLRRILSNNREWKKEIVGRYMVYEHRHMPEFLPELLSGLRS